ncbi:hypothetical protein TWF481_009994 [Arthrobotrys musiformis]|uniref:Pex N-terminal domain-containing protein n=1 Tax=Arthrobotrys musiformis TaxID=47236 RepID=A0AAV9W2A9_9PEZI
MALKTLWVHRYDISTLLTTGERLSVGLLISEGIFEWNQPYMFAYTLFLSNGLWTTSQLLGFVGFWVNLIKDELIEPAALARVFEHTFRSPEPSRVGISESLLKLDWRWGSELLSYSTLCRILEQVSEHVALEFLERILPTFETQPEWTGDKRFSIILSAILCEAFDILVFLLRRGYNFRGDRDSKLYRSGSYKLWESISFIYPEVKCGNIRKILAVPSAAILATGLGERQQLGWERSLETAFPGIDAQKIFSEDLQQLPLEIRMLFANCRNCNFRRSFNPVDRCPEKRSRALNDVGSDCLGISQGPKLPDSPEWCYDCGFSTLECPNCGEIPLELQAQELNESASKEESIPEESEPLSTPDQIMSPPPPKRLGSKLLGWSASYLRHLGPSGALIAALLVAVLYLLYKLNQSENIRRSMVDYNKGFDF